MKKIILTIGIAILTGVSIKAQTTTTEATSISTYLDSASFTVSGNCGMCQRTIEKAALISGVTSAEWDMESGKMNVVFNHKETNILKIHKAIAASGYDTDKVKAEVETYNSLPGCCQYDRTKE
jgi:mercuric ion binding protein